MATMKAVRYHGNRDLRLDNIPVPEVKHGQIKVKPAWAGICGTDLHEYTVGPLLCPTSPHGITNESIPLTLGHEFSGTVTQIGTGVLGFALGDRVVLEPIIFDGTCSACRVGHLNCCARNGFVGLSGYGGGFAEAIVLDSQYFQHLPEGVSLKTGALIEPLSVAMRAVRNATIASRSAIILILGAGPIGLAITLCLRARGHKTIIISEPSSGRRKLATDVGASMVLDPTGIDVLAEILKITGDAGGVDVVFDCAGVQAAWDVGMRAVREKGTIVCVAVWEKKCQVDINQLLFRERRMVGSAAPEHIDFMEVFEALRSGALKPDALVTKTVRLEDVEGGFQSLIEDRETHAKILVEVAGGE